MFEYDEAEKCLIMIDHSESVNGTESLALTPKLYLDKSAAGRAVLEKRIVLSPDIATDQRILPATRKALLKEGRKSALFIPLLFQNRVLGVMNLMFTQKYSFADYEIETLFSIGKTIGLAMANAKYIEQIKADVEERIIAQVALHKTEQSLSESQQNAKISNESLKIINAVADRIYLAHDYDALVQEAMEAVKLYGKTSAVVMFECNEDENTIALLSTSAEPKEFKATTVRLTSTLLPKSLTAQTIHEKRIIICEDAANDERINPEIKKMLIQYNLTYAISIPLLFRDKTLGVINLFFTEKYNFTDYELETLLSIGKTIGMAMANARNIEQIKAEIEERKKAQESMARSIASLQAVNTIADKVYGALDYDTLTRQAMSAISSYGNTSEVSMYEYHEDSDMLTVIGISIGELSDEVEAVRLGRKLSAKESIGGAAIHEKNIIVCTNIPDDQRIRADIKAAIIKDGHKAVISLPLLFQKRAMGVMNLFFNEAVNFNDYQLDTLFSIGKTIGLAMANARHIQQIKAEVEDRKIAQEALRQSEGKYRLLIENASDAIFIGQKGFITYANSRALELLGYTMEELTQKPIASYLIDETEKSKRKKTGMKSAYGIESFILINKKNEELSLDVHIIDIVWENKEASLYFGRDVTGQEKMEAQLYQAQKMEAIGTLAGGLAHDFNNLLMGIEGNTSLMLLQIPVSHPHYERLKNIEHYVTNGAEITAQLLGFARGGKYEVIPININKLIEKSASMFGRTKKEISIHENFGKNIWAVEVDRGQIEQVLLNLFVNAWQAMPGGGNMYLLTANQEMDENLAGIHGIKSGRYVKISVTDDGMGMDEETQRRLFDPFFTTKVRGRGTGLGLPSAYGIIKNHGGVITVYSEKNRGTTFNLYLPASGKEVAEEDTIAEDSLYAGKETILFVDDEEMIVDVGRDMLESMGYTVITARSGKAALEIYAEKMNNIDLVILDLIMPELGGEATFEKLKEINPGVKVLLSSGYSISGLANKLLSLGCRGFIQKPYSIKEFSARIRETLDMK
jgi:PAS domain S-box-containing protein